MISELEMMWKEMVVAYLRALSRDMSGRTEEYHITPASRSPSLNRDLNQTSSV
jgi:hypothetical protein